MDAALGRVLIVGRDQIAMNARASLLEHFWSTRTSSVEAGELPEINADLVVVCDSLPDAERQELVERVRAQAPTMLIVKMNGYDCGPHASADATVDERHGPGALVSTIYELLTERGLGSRGWPIEGETTVQ